MFQRINTPTSILQLDVTPKSYTADGSLLLPAMIWFNISSYLTSLVIRVQQLLSFSLQLGIMFLLSFIIFTSAFNNFHDPGSSYFLHDLHPLGRLSQFPVYYQHFFKYCDKMYTMVTYAIQIFHRYFSFSLTVLVGVLVPPPYLLYYFCQPCNLFQKLYDLLVLVHAGFHMMLVDIYHCTVGRNNLLNVIHVIPRSLFQTFQECPDIIIRYHPHLADIFCSF